MDRLEEWRLFVAVATLKSFSAAARSRRRSPQSATRGIAALEARLGTPLLRRTTRSVSLTDDGERYLERCRRALAAVDELEAPAPARIAGTVTVTAPVLFGQLYVLPVVLDLLAREPAVDVRLVLLDRVVSLAEEGIDVAVRIGPLPDSALRARGVGEVHLVTCASPAYLASAGTPRTPNALAKHTCIGFAGTSSERWVYPGERRGVAVRPRLTVNTGQAAIDAALAGAGVVRALSYQVAEHVARGELVSILRSFEPAPSAVQLVQLPGLQTRAASAFLELAAETLAARLRSSPSRATPGARSSSRARASS